MRNTDGELRAQRRKRIKIITAVLLVIIALFFAVRALWWNRAEEESALLSLVSHNEPLEQECRPQLAEVRGVDVDERCAVQLEQMLSDCEAAGFVPVVLKGYISREEQTELFEGQVAWLIANGATEDEAPGKALWDVFYPGTDEHELGLAVDIVDGGYRTLDTPQSHTGTYKWLSENAHKYGFVVRYPDGKFNLTGRYFSPWHYRYVGEEAATQMYQLELCLEEYLMWFFSEEAIVVYS